MGIAFTSTAVIIALIVAVVLFVIAIVGFLVSQKKGTRNRWSWWLIVLCICALVSAAVNANIFFK